ncbi:F-box/WD repeat-containing protein 4 isoform X2 [Cavia porcellus]|uniref:F-box/WD repeat-containing protein 4 isoform X2 n=1 Tax=Cavia porcellus TaxID=10141 RepID=UPI002FE2143F
MGSQGRSGPPASGEGEGEGESEGRPGKTKGKGKRRKRGKARSGSGHGPEGAPRSRGAAAHAGLAEQGAGAAREAAVAGSQAAMTTAMATAEEAAGPSLWRLPEELLLLVCSYLDARALGRLAQVCRTLRRVTSYDLPWRRIARASLNAGFSRLGTDLMNSVPVKERVKVSQNWRLGRCREGILLKWRCSQMPWMQLEDNSLYISQANFILAYQFRPDGASLNHRPLGVFAGHDEDVCHFVLANSHIVSAGGSFVTGTACCGHFSPLRIWDLNSGQLMSHLGSDFPPGAGVLDVMYESPSTLLSCGYDTYIRYWDLRTSTRKCVMEWEEPHDSTLYCLQTDGNHLLATGSSYYGVVRLWDRRQRACLHAFPLTSTPLSSPVYCLRFTTTHLYAALSYNLHVLDFKNP